MSIEQDEVVEEKSSDVDDRDSAIHQPHDKFFRSAMGSPKIARDFFEYYLPKKIKEIVRLETIVQKKDTYVDKHLSTLVTDMVYSVEMKGETGYFYILVEHMRTSERLMAFRVMSYIFRIMAQHLETHGGDDLPLVFPIVLYNGGRRYTHTTDIFKLFKNEALAREIFLKPFKLLDLTQISDGDLKEKDAASILLLPLKHTADQQEVLSWIETMIPGLKLIDEQNRRDTLISVITYLLNSGKVSDLKRLVQVIHEKLPPKTDQENLMTMEEHFENYGKKIGFQEGMEKGMEKGMERGVEKERLSVALRLVKMGKISPEEIAEVSGLDLDVVLRQCKIIT